MNASRNLVDDIAAILHPMPTYTSEPADDAEQSVRDAERDAVEVARDRVDTVLNFHWDEHNDDPLLIALTQAKQQRDEADAHIRRLIAYGREFVAPRPYTLDDLAEAAGMSISGIRTAYDHGTVAAVATDTGARPREWRNPDKTGSVAVAPESFSILHVTDAVADDLGYGDAHGMADVCGWGGTGHFAIYLDGEVKTWAENLAAATDLVAQLCGRPIRLTETTSSKGHHSWLVAAG